MVKPRNPRDDYLDETGLLGDEDLDLGAFIASMERETIDSRESPVHKRPAWQRIEELRDALELRRQLVDWDDWDVWGQD